MGKKKRGKKRGHPQAIILSFRETRELHAHWWIYFQHQIRSHAVLKLGRKIKSAGEKDLYHFFEQLINNFRPFWDEGMRSLILCEPPGMKLIERFQEHIKKHHQWLLRERDLPSLQITQIEFQIEDITDVSKLTETPDFQSLFQDSIEGEIDQILELLEKRLNDPQGVILYTLDEIEDLLYQKHKKRDQWAEYLLMVQEMFDNADPKIKNRLNRLLQIASNKGVSIKVVNQETPAGEKLMMYGGLICFTKIPEFQMY